MRHLMRTAAAMGLRVHGTYMPPGRLGFYSPSESRIYFDIRLTPIERRSTIAHELGHARYGHTCDDPSSERQADIYAARLLIEPRRYAELERVNPDQHQLAEDLGVTHDLIVTYERHCLTRIEGATYALARMGGNQWAYRGVPAS